MCSCTMVDGWNIIAGRSLVVRANGGFSDHVTKPGMGAELSDRILIKVQFSALDTLPKEGHRMRRKIHTSLCTTSGEAADCEGM